MNQNHWQKLVVLGIVAAALGIAVFFILRRDHVRNRDTHVLAFDPRDIQRFRLQTRGYRGTKGFGIEFSRAISENQRGRWGITYRGTEYDGQVHFAADQIEVDEYLFHLSRIKIARRINIKDLPRSKRYQPKPKDPSPKEKQQNEKQNDKIQNKIQDFFNEIMPYIVDKYYGFSPVPPYFSMRFDLFTVSGKVHTIFFGDTSPAGGYYVIRYPEKHIFLIKQPNLTAFTKKLFDFRDKRVIKHTPIRYLFLKRGTNRYRFRRRPQSDVWTYRGRTLTHTRIQGVLTLLRDLKARSFPRGRPPRHKVPYATISYRGGDASGEGEDDFVFYTIPGAKNRGILYATAGKAHPFTISRHPINRIFEMAAFAIKSPTARD